MINFFSFACENAEGKLAGTYRLRHNQLHDVMRFKLGAFVECSQNIFSKKKKHDFFNAFLALRNVWV